MQSDALLALLDDKLRQLEQELRPAKLHVRALEENYQLWIEVRKRHIADQAPKHAPLQVASALHEQSSASSAKKPHERRGLYAAGWKREAYELLNHHKSGLVPQRLATIMGYKVKKIRDILYQGVALGHLRRADERYKITDEGTAFLHRSVPYRGRSFPGIPSTMSSGSATATTVLPIEKGTVAAVLATTDRKVA